VILGKIEIGQRRDLGEGSKHGDEMFRDRR
jgi:hypothetical protein